MSDIIFEYAKGFQTNIYVYIEHMKDIMAAFLRIQGNMMSKKNLLCKMGTLSLLTLISSYSYSREKIDTSIWSTYQGNKQHTGYVPITINTKKIIQSWQATVGETARSGLNFSIHQASVSPKLVFVARNNYAYSNTLQAFAIENGKEIWSKSFGEARVQPSAYSDGIVYVQTVNNYSPKTLLRAYQEDNGESIFNAPFSAQWQSYNSPVIDGDIVYGCSGYMSGLTAYNKRTGEKFWNVSFYDLSDKATIAINDKYAVYYNAGKLIKLNKNNGTIVSTITDSKWSWNGYDDTTPVLDGNQYAYISIHNHLTKFNLASDEVVYTIDDVTGYPSIDSENIYIIHSALLTAYDKKTGLLKWEINSENGKPEGMLVTKNAVFLSNYLGTTAYSKRNNHKALWHTTIHGELSLTNQGLFIVSHSGTLTRFTV